MNESAATWEGVETLVPWKDNPRHNGAAIAKIADSIQRFGFGSPIVARAEDRMVIAGHTRLEAAKSLGLDRVPVRFLDLDPADAKMLALADNRLGEIADWDDEKLTSILKELSEEEGDLGVLGWEDDDLAAFFGEDDLTPSWVPAELRAPVYEPTGPCPEVSDLFDATKTMTLLQRIEAAEVPEDVRRFLRAAAHRHTVVRYDRVAEFYAHAEADVQELFEESALVIIDLGKAIEHGFARLHGDLTTIFDDEHPNDG